MKGGWEGMVWGFFSDPARGGWDLVVWMGTIGVLGGMHEVVWWLQQNDGFWYWFLASNSGTRVAGSISRDDLGEKPWMGADMIC